MQVKIFSDGANFSEMMKMNENPLISGLTTNPTLMHRSGVSNYTEFCKSVLDVVKVKPVSFEVFSDDFSEMEKQSKIISSWGKNVYVKIPIMNTKGEYSYSLIKKLVNKGIKVNVTAILTLEQVDGALSSLDSSIPSFISVFAGRIADTGVDPLPIMKSAVDKISHNNKCELIWASTRELLNVVQANSIGCHIITVTNEILKKMDLIGYNLENLSLETVRMFYQDSVKAGFKI